MPAQENQVILQDFFLSRKASLPSPATLRYYQPKVARFLNFLEREEISLSLTSSLRM